MHVLLVGPDLEENLSLRFLSAALKKAGHTTAISTFDSADDAAAVRSAASSTDLVALSMCYQIRAREFLALARALKADDPQRPIVAGGHYASCAASDLLQHHPELDLVVIHEGEHALVELAALPARHRDALANIPGIVFRDGNEIVASAPRPSVIDLDSLPWADRTGPARLVSGVPTAYMMGSRGCVNSCDYCCISTLHRLVPGRHFRQRTPDDIVQEMAWLYHERGVRQFVFHDDNFLVPAVDHNLQRIAALDRGMRKHGLRHVGLVLKCRPADVNEEVFRRLREMGLLRVFLGIESGSAGGLASIGRHQQTVAQAHAAHTLCEQLDISTQYTMIFVHPDATAQSIRADLAFVKQHPAHPMSYCRAQIYAGTPLEKRMIEAGRARGDYLARTYDFSDPVVTAFWEVGQHLFWDRCFNQQHLQGQSVRLDHLMAVARHAYEDREIDRLSAEFLTVQQRLNVETVALLEELLGHCEESPDPGSELLRQHAASIAQREAPSRIELQSRICELREELLRLTRELVGLPMPGGRAAPRRKRSTARHAAAVLLAVGAISGASQGCIFDGGVFEAPPYDAAQPDGAAHDTGWHDDSGVYEAPPFDAAQPDTAATDASAPTDASADSGESDTGSWIDDGGVFEAPPQDQ